MSVKIADPNNSSEPQQPVEHQNDCRSGKPSAVLDGDLEHISPKRELPSSPSAGGPSTCGSRSTIAVAEINIGRYATRDRSVRGLSVACPWPARAVVGEDEVGGNNETTPIDLKRRRKRE